MKRALIILLAGSALAACHREESPPLHTVATAAEDAPAQSAPRTPTQPVQPADAQRAPAAKVPPAEALNDTFIEGKIRASVMTDPSMKGADVSVNSDHGVVSLAGTVKSQEQSAIASAHAQQEDGVMRVENTLVVQAD